ncbi:MAG: hypothetical protein ACTHKL_19165, partial [Streptosporangiaceae bacterium]
DAQSPHPLIAGPDVLAAFWSPAPLTASPASTLTDNGMVLTTRLSGGRDAFVRWAHILQVYP